MEQMGLRKGDLSNMIPDGKGRVRLEYTIPARGLIGFRNNFLTLTSGTGILTSTFSHYGPIKAGEVSNRQNGVLVSMATGTALTYSLETLQSRGKLFLGPGDEIYEGQLAGINSRDNDLVINRPRARSSTTCALPARTKSSPWFRRSASPSSRRWSSSPTTSWWK